MDIDLLHTRVNGDRHANGVIGGHTPASPSIAITLYGASTVALPPNRRRLVASAAPVCLAQARWAFAGPLVWVLPHPAWDEPEERESEVRLRQRPCAPAPTPVPDSASTRPLLLLARRGLVPTEPLE